MPLSEHVHYVAITFKMTEWVEQEMHINFCIKLEYVSAETIQVIQKAAAMGNWWLAASSQQWTRSCITSHAEFFFTQPPYNADSVPCHFCLFPKLKLPLKGKRFQTIDEIQENTMGQLMVIERTVWGPKVPPLKGTESYIVSCTMFLLSCIFFSKCLCFSYYLAGYFLERNSISVWLFTT